MALSASFTKHLFNSFSSFRSLTKSASGNRELTSISCYPEFPTIPKIRMTSRQPHTVMWPLIWPASTHLRSSSVFLSRIWSLSLKGDWLWLRGREVIRAPAAQGDGKPPRWDFSPRWRPCCRPGSTMEGASGSLPCSSVRRNVASAVPWCSLNSGQ